MTRRVREPSRSGDDLPFHYREAMIPERFWTATPDAINNANLRAWLKGTLAGPHTWLGTGLGFYLNGPFNSGKSAISAILGMDAVKRCEVVTWLPVRDVPRVRFREDDEAKKIDARIKRSDVLVLDDVGAERFRLSGAAGSALEEIVRIIYERKRTLIISSNLSWRQFSEGYGREAPALLSVVERIVTPIEVLNDQWPKGPMSGGPPAAR